jgi:hypothetical protein
MGLASGADPTLDVLAELAGVWVGGLALEQGQLLFQFLGFGLDVGQARLPVFGMDSVIGGVGVGDQGAVEALAQDRLGGLGGTVRVQVEESQIGISGIPLPVGIAIMPPGGFVSMGDGQGANLLPQILIERQPPAHGLSFEAVSTGGHEAQAEEIAEELADLDRKSVV